MHHRTDTGGAGGARPGRAALRDVWPLLVPVVPFGLVYGVVVSDASTSTFWGWVLSPLATAGASQLTLVTLVDEGATIVAALASACVINARHLMYSAAVSPAFGDQPRWFRHAGSFVLVDQVFALTSARAETDPWFRRRYWLTAGYSFWALWVVMTSVGVAFGSFVPASWRIEFAVVVLFLSIVVNGLTARPAVVAAVTGFGVAAAAGPLPHRLGLLTGALTGVVVGTIAEVRRP